MATGICISFCEKKKGPQVLHLKTAIEAAHYTENVPILHTKVKEENIFCSLYTMPLLVFCRKEPSSFVFLLR